MSIYFSSDLHFGHEKDFIYKPRGFSSAEEMAKQTIKNFHKTVGANDELWILGDLILGDLVEGKKLLKQLPGQIHVILGNHDSENRIQFYKEMGWDPQYAKLIRINEYQIYLSHYPTLTQNFNLKPLHRETLNFHGHTHQTTNFMPNQFCMYHVGVDSHNNYPVLFEDIINDLSEYRKFYKKVI